MNVRFWGTRGSIPTPGSATLRYGGNTPCVALTTAQGTLVILDCGSGVRELGNHLLRRKNGPIRGYVFISHVHWDHIQGFPFFAPAFVPGNSFKLFAPYDLEERLEAVLEGQMEFEYFPITLDRMEADIRFEELREGHYPMGDFEVAAMAVQHTAPCLGYRVVSGGRSAVYLTDVEPAEGFPADGRFRLDHPRDRALVEFARGADLLIHDGQYTLEEYRGCVGFGHSPYEFAVRVALEAGARRLALFHHDPTHDDPQVEAMVDDARRLAEEAGGRLEVLGAAEGLEVDL